VALFALVVLQAVGALEPSVGFKSPSKGFYHTTFMRVVKCPSDVEGFKYGF
jgi:hypothetical protein